MRKGLGPLVPAVQADLVLTFGARGRPPKPSHISHTFVQKQNHPFGGWFCFCADAGRSSTGEAVRREVLADSRVLPEPAQVNLHLEAIPCEH